jgi:hypothetical protein
MVAPGGGGSYTEKLGLTTDGHESTRMKTSAAGEL